MLGPAGALGGVEHAVRVGLALEPIARSLGAGGRVGFLRPLDMGGDAGAHGALFGGELPGHAGLSRTPAQTGEGGDRARAHRILSCGRYGTLLVVSEQSAAYRVTFYCDRCAQRWGRGPILAVADREPWMVEGDWRLQVTRRSSRPISPERVKAGSIRSYSGGAIPDRPRSIAPKPGRFQLVPLHAFETSAAQLVCPKCKARPRVALAKLVELAEQALAAGRRDAYV
jgi:hypothetical protein